MCLKRRPPPRTRPKKTTNGQRNSWRRKPTNRVQAYSVRRFRIGSPAAPEIFRRTRHLAEGATSNIGERGRPQMVLWQAGSGGRLAVFRTRKEEMRMADEGNMSTGDVEAIQKLKSAYDRLKAEMHRVIVGQEQ